MIYLDIETLDFFQDPHIAALPRNEQITAIRFGCAVTYNSAAGQWRQWREADVGHLRYYLYQANTPIVGWNIVDFDWPVILHSVQRLGYAIGEPGKQPPMINLFALIRQATGRWYKLDVIAEENLGCTKTSHGQQATEWLRSGDPQLIQKALDYCEADVMITADLHQVLLEGLPLSLPPRPARGEHNYIHFRLDDGQPVARWVVGEDGVLSTR